MKARLHMLGLRGEVGFISGSSSTDSGFIVLKLTYPNT